MSSRLTGTNLAIGNTTLTEVELQQIKINCGLFDIGDTLIINGIESYVLYKDEGTGYGIAADKNHDLSYYVNGSDYVNSNNYQSPGTFGYEWGGSGIDTNIRTTAIGTGLSNTNSLIEMNLQPDTSGWYVVWDKIKEFRQNHSDNWFLPSKDELNLIYEARANLSNLSLSTNPYYWSSSEGHNGHSWSGSQTWIQQFDSGDQYLCNKSARVFRSRLCYYINFNSIDRKSVV